MTLQPQSIEAEESLLKAREMMNRFQIRHLPVTKEGKLVGILSQREIRSTRDFETVDPAQLLVIDACSENPYCVDPETSLREAAKVMAEKRYGSVIVIQGEEVVGIFTTVDACRALAQIIESNIQRTNLKNIFDVRRRPLSRFDL